MHQWQLPDRWLVHAYYTVSPYAPDGSSRVLAAGADLDTGRGEVLVFSADGEVLDRFGDGPAELSFYHTGRWQTWSPDARHVYYTAGSLHDPMIVRRELSTGVEVAVPGDLEGSPPGDAPVLSGLLGMLHAAGAGDGSYRPDSAPVPFGARDRHGLFRYSFEPPGSELILSVDQALGVVPDPDRLRAADQAATERFGDGLTLMTYCVRWTPDASRLLFHVGNHLAPRSRGEERILYVMTAAPDLTDLHVAVDLSYGLPGVHWSWQPDGEHLIGYGPLEDDPARMGLAEVARDGTGYRIIAADDASGGHPSVSPADPDLVVTDEWTDTGGNVVFLSRSSGQVHQRVPLPRKLAGAPPGRSPMKTDHHPVFGPQGDRVLVNTLPGRHAELWEVPTP